jgi:hypothetical protein
VGDGKAAGGGIYWARELEQNSDTSSPLEIIGLECHSWACSKGTSVPARLW